MGIVYKEGYLYDPKGCRYVAPHFTTKEQAGAWLKQHYPRTVLQ